MAVCLLVLVGLPGSGKTWLARQLCTTLSSKYCPTHVEYDVIISLHQQAKLQAARAEGNEGGVWRSLRREVEVAIENAIVASESNASHESCNHVNQSILEDTASAFACDDQLSDGLSLEALRDILSSLSLVNENRPRVVIIDDNMYLGSMRYRLYQLARRRRLGFCQVFLDTPEPLCLRRNAERAQQLPAEVITTMAAKLERPDPACRLWEATTAVLTPASYSLSSVEALIAQCLAAPAEPIVDNRLEVEHSRLVCSTNQVHQADVVARRLVRQHAAAAPEASRGERARAANAARQALLARLRSGQLGVAVQPSEQLQFEQLVATLFRAQLSCCGSDS